jgi:hypothetical protein
MASNRHEELKKLDTRDTNAFYEHFCEESDLELAVG